MKTSCLAFYLFLLSFVLMITRWIILAADTLSTVFLHVNILEFSFNTESISKI